MTQILGASAFCLMILFTLHSYAQDADPYDPNFNNGQEEFPDWNKGLSNMPYSPPSSPPNYDSEPRFQPWNNPPPVDNDFRGSRPFDNRRSGDSMTTPGKVQFKLVPGKRKKIYKNPAIQAAKKAAKSLPHPSP